MVLIYINDLIITSDHNITIINLKRVLNHKFAIKDLGALKYFFSLEMATSHKELFF